MKTGTHRMRATAGILTETSQNHREQVFVKLAMSSDPNDTVAWQGYFGDNIDKGGKTLTERTVDALRCMGWEGDDLTDLSTITKNEVEVVVVNDEYQGETRLKARFVQAIGTAAKFMPEGLPANYAKSFAERMKSRISGKRAAPGDVPIDREPGSDDY